MRNFIRVTLIGSLGDLILSFRSSVPGRRSVGCIGSKVAFHCGLVCSSTCRTGWVNSIRLSLSSATVFVVDVVVIIDDVGDVFRVIGVTVFISRIILVVFSLLPLFFQQAALISVMSCFLYNGGTLVWVCQHWCLSVVGAQCLSVAHQGLPNHSALTPFPGVGQFVHTCHSPSGPDLLISSGVVAFWRIWIVRWWHGQPIQVRLWPVFEVHRENLPNYDLLDSRRVSGIYVSLLPSIGFLHTCFGKPLGILPSSFGLGHYCF